MIAAIVPPSPPLSPRRAAAMEIVWLHTGLCAAANFVPVPLLDSLVVSGVQFQMVEALAVHYGASFSRERGRALLKVISTGIVHETVTHSATSRWLGSEIARIPAIGPRLGAFAWPALLATWTYALGKSYVDHYEAGGQFADFKFAGVH